MKELALTCTDPVWRVPDQALLAMIAGHVAGPGANHPQLRTARHGEVFLAFVDWLLTENMREGKAA